MMMNERMLISQWIFSKEVTHQVIDTFMKFEITDYDKIISQIV